MCRLFGLSAAPRRVRATFWLLEAPDSLLAQSHREPDGTGLGYFARDGTPHVDKQPIAAFADRAFAREAREVHSRTFVAHVRFASSGGLTPDNTHPFQQHSRLLAHNGVIGDLTRLEAELGDYAGLVRGETDSERFFALVTKQIDAHDGDVTAGLTAAARWVARELALYALNVILVTDGELWALRYPDMDGPLRARASGRWRPRRSPRSTTRARAARSAFTRTISPIIPQSSSRASEWTMTPAGACSSSGELLHVDAKLAVSSTIAVDHPPRHPLALADLGPRAAASQAAPAT